MCSALLAAVFTVAGCNQASSPASVHEDVAKARDSASDQNAKADQNEAKVDAKADAEASKADQKADQRMAGAAYDTAVVEAEGTHKIASAKCESMSGDAQKACKERADADLATAKASAKAERDKHQQ
jgi:hypothetical protein